ncbi:DUF1097 domain-containing protein [Bordetella bronchialis]|uniref:DUF1097 domain-containing protein n=1 Tax=Bordetella bronchialis TaxID=463025 RepID=A0ABN4QYV4_9BORD|nr:DUF1097 domain-containing protein [Bordetella bronchialis]ANN66208.1 hypothetical protein BAU06_07800 [Bordetella bronchialis]
MAAESWNKHARIVLGESLVASSAATFSALVLELPVWAMFVGWIAYFTRGLDLRSGLVNLACVLIGLALGMAAAHAMAAFSPLLGAYAITAVVTAITAIALSLARMPVFNNLLGFFLGLVAYFASHMPPSPATFLSLGGAAAIGAAAGFLAHAWQGRVKASRPGTEGP